MTPGDVVIVTRSHFAGRTGTVAEPLPRDANWPEYVRVQLDATRYAPIGACLLLKRDCLKRHARAGQMDLLGGVS